MVAERSTARGQRSTRDAPEWVDEKKDERRRNRESVMTLETAPPNYGDVMKEV